MRVTFPASTATSPFDLFNSEGYKAQLTFDTSENFNILMNTTPAGACTSALAGAGAGNVDNGTHSYKVTFVTATGETNAGTVSNTTTVADKTVNGQIALTAIPVSTFPGVTSRKIYRTAAGNAVTGPWLLQSTIANNTATTATDNVADAALGATAPTGNTTLDNRFTVSNAGSVLALDGNTTNPSFAFINNTNRGILNSTSSNGGIDVAMGGGIRLRLVSGSGAQYGLTLGGTTDLRWNNGSILQATNDIADLVVSRVAAGAMLIAGAAGAQLASLRQSGGNGGYLSHGCQTELTTIAAAATTDTVIQIPANSILISANVYVHTVIPTAATFTVTGATSGTTFSTAAVSTAAGSTDLGTAAGAFYYVNAQAVRFTPNAVPAAATGKVRIVIFYYTVVPPTS